MSTTPLSVPDRLGRNRQAKNGFYDPELGVLFLHSAGVLLLSYNSGRRLSARFDGAKQSCMILRCARRRSPGLAESTAEGLLHSGNRRTACKVRWCPRGLDRMKGTIA